MSDPRTRLKYLLGKHAGNQASEEEKRELSTLLEKNWEETASGQEAPHIDWENMLKTIKAESRQIAEIRPVRRLHPTNPLRRLDNPRGVWYRSAAAILVLLAAGVVFYVNHQKKQEPARLALIPADVLPGGKKAVLTLAGGQQIILDSAHQGNLTIQGSAQVSKPGNGKLSYQVIGNAATGATGTRGGAVAGAGAGTVAVVYNTLSVPRGGQYELTLPDGTHVWLNAASSITYPTAFTGATREVSMTGEAYFEVTYNAKQPFRVKAGNSTIEDLGTHFNINAYTDEPVLRTTLLEGKLAVQSGEQRRVLSPGEQAETAGAGGVGGAAGVGGTGGAGSLFVRNDVDPDEVVAWKNGLFQFKHADIRIVMRQIARWYDVDVRFEGPVSTDRFWGKLPRDAKASQVLNVLQKEQVHFRIEGKTIIVTK